MRSGRYFPFVIARPVDGDACVSRFIVARPMPRHSRYPPCKPAFSLTEFEASIDADCGRSHPAPCRAAADSVWWSDVGRGRASHDGPFDAALFLRLLDAD